MAHISIFKNNFENVLFLQSSSIYLIEKNLLYLFLCTLLFVFLFSTISCLHSLNQSNDSFYFFFLFSQLSLSLPLFFLAIFRLFSSSHLAFCPIRIFARYSYLSQSPRGRFSRFSFQAPRDADRCCLPNSCIRIFLTGHRAFDSARSNYTLQSVRACPRPFSLSFYQPSRFSGS